MARFLRPQQPHDRAKRLLGWCATATFLIWLAVAGRHVTGLAFDYGSGYSSSPAPGAGMAEEPAMAVRTMSMQSSQQAAIVQEPVPAEQQLAEQAQLPEEQAEQLGTGDSQQQAEAAPEGARVIGTYIHALPDGTEISKDLLDEPLPGDCHAESNADYAGPALTWGLTYKLASAAQCCQACKDFKPNAEQQGMVCNVWVWCPDPSGQCWSPDAWNHTSGECWLKFQQHWDNSVDLSSTNLAVNIRGDYPPEFRQEHTTAPVKVPWMAGVIPRQT